MTTKKQLEKRIFELEEQVNIEYNLRLKLVRQLEEGRAYALQQEEKSAAEKLRADLLEARAHSLMVSLSLATIGLIVLGIFSNL